MMVKSQDSQIQPAHITQDFGIIETEKKNKDVHYITSQNWATNNANGNNKGKWLLPQHPAD